KDKPQLRFLSNRVITANLTINISNYQKRKTVLIKQIEAITGYAVNAKDCRAQIIAHYFNDLAAQPCGICDNCIEKKKTTLSHEDFSVLQSDIKKALGPGPLTIKELMRQLRVTDEKKTW